MAEWSLPYSDIWRTAKTTTGREPALSNPPDDSPCLGAGAYVWTRCSQCGKSVAHESDYWGQFDLNYCEECLERINAAVADDWRLRTYGLTRVYDILYNESGGLEWIPR